MSLTQRVFSDAFRDMQRAMAAFDQPFYNTARRSLLGSPASLFNDMVETPESYELSAELPGCNKDNIKIELADSRTLVLSGTVNESKEIKPPTATEEEVNTTASTEGADTTATTFEATKSDASAANNEQQLTQKASSEVAKPIENSPQWWVKERVSGSFTRSFAFPTPINSESIKASFDNGVLKVVIPKTAQDQAKQINIE
ncbi:hypothetical protein MBANPS3_005753 [Mucor bainieri]